MTDNEKLAKLLSAALEIDCSIISLTKDGEDIFISANFKKSDGKRRKELQQNVNEDAQALVDALLRGERADAYCGYGRDGQASNYRDELKWSLHEFNKLHPAS